MFFFYREKYINVTFDCFNELSGDFASEPEQLEGKFTEMNDTSEFIDETLFNEISYL